MPDVLIRNFPQKTSACSMSRPFDWVSRGPITCAATYNERPAARQVR